MILQAQAVHLDEATDNLLQGHTKRDFNGVFIVTELSIRVPILNSFQVTIVQVRHGALMYPVTVINILDNYSERVCQDPNALVEQLKAIFQSTQVKRIIASLWGQAKAGFSV